LSAKACTCVVRITLCCGHMHCQHSSVKTCLPYMDEGTHGLPVWAHSGQPTLSNGSHSHLPLASLGCWQIPCCAVTVHISSASARFYKLTPACTLLESHSSTNLVVISQVVNCIRTLLQEWGLHPHTPTLPMQQMPAPPQTGPSVQT